MPLFEQEFLRPGRCHVGGKRYCDFTASELGRYAENTRALLRGGYCIPVLQRHAPPGSAEGGPRKVSAGKLLAGRHPRQVGQLVDLWQQADGSLVHVIDVLPQYATWIGPGGVLHTSPELRRRFIDADGRRLGPVIAHVALAARPLIPNQTPLQRREEVLQFSHHNVAGGKKNMSDETRDDTDQVSTDVPVQDAENQPPLKEMPETDQAVPQEPSTAPLAAVASAPMSSSFVQSAEAALSEEEVAPDGQQTNIPHTEMSDEDAATDSPTHQDEAASDYRCKLSERIARSKRLPKGLRDRLCSVVETVQFSADGIEEPTLRVSDAVAMIEESIPPHMRLDPDELEQSDHPAGEGFFTGDAAQLSDQEAERIAHEQLISAGFVPRE